ncbi:hypothetical protein BXU11_01255 [Flavobacterium sp. LM5]|uniref:hypothetical protein n=1 Tax=Flavobacterium sp. LM5 TaxID=1938610 RepID=UPI0009935884|nr:hypothetical protein [Flavobacterium sp. LM5]OOV28607.1 hypothetical protein BXU11_01255 [Flavobacterium sp. LM5]
MESIAYIVTNKFILILADTNFELKIGDEEIKKNDAQKVSVLLDNLAIACVGEFYKTSDISNYVWKLNELGHNNSFDEIIEDLESSFGTDNITEEMLRKQNELYIKFTDLNGNIDTVALLNSIKDDKIMYPFVRDVFITLQGGFNPTSIALFSVENNPFRIRVGNYNIKGNHMVGSETNILTDHIFIHSMSATKDENTIAQLTNKAHSEINKFVFKNWENDDDAVNKLIEVGKITLTNIIESISPYPSKPNVVVYELSKNTNYIFKDPETHLKRYNFNRF